MRFFCLIPLALALLCSTAAAPPGQAAGAAKPTHWAFVPPRSPALPRVRNARWVRNPIDHFILARLEREGLKPSPEADRITLIRRLSLDLIGLPPNPAEVASFLGDVRGDAYERLVDRLLASPHYGEQWGRHWLDLARYADSDGYEKDSVRPYAWLYRDWVIDALNRDLPFDQFTIEQLAGDLLPDPTAPQKVATGFHRQTLTNKEGGVDQEEFRCKAVVDRVDTTGAVWLGLTVGCAECHTHKYDPISQREFFQLYAFFNNASERELAMPRPDELADYEKRTREWEMEKAPLDAKLKAFSGDTNSATWTNLSQKLARQLKRQPRFPETKSAVLAEEAKPRETRIHIRGDFLRPGDPVQPATLAVLHPFKPRRDHPDRLDLARWLVDPANPLTSRVTVNRTWGHLFGRGLTPSMDDFGTRGEKPSHPELLDWLACEFIRPVEELKGSRVDSGATSTVQPFNSSTLQSLHPSTPRPWSQKALIKLIVTSATYRQSSRFRTELAGLDPGNVLLARQNRLRLEAENVRDACLAVSGLLQPQIGGPSVRPPLPADIAAIGYANSVKWKESEGPDRHRRGLYIFFQRTVPYPMLTTFDAPDSNVTCTRRERSNTPLQALALLNDPVFFECAQALARKMSQEPTERIKRGFELCLTRPPRREELSRLEKLYRDHLRLAQANPLASPMRAERGSVTRSSPGIGDALRVMEPRSETPRLERDMENAALVAVARTLLNLDEFVTRE